MEEFVKGDIVIIDFPFSSGKKKRRPALVFVNLKGEDLILFQVTSTKRINSIEIEEKDFLFGKLNVTSFVRIEKIFTLEKKKVLYLAGHLIEEKFIEIHESFLKLVNS